MNTLKLVTDNSRPINENISERISNVFTKLDHALDCYIDYMSQVEPMLLDLPPEQLDAFEEVLDRILGCSQPK
jgi:hypothetical protein